MERVSIQEASRRLNISQHDVREYIRRGDLKASREGGPNGRKWMVELPGDGWVDDFKARLEDMDRILTRWWWTNSKKSGLVHYVDSLGIEEVEPLFLCRETSEDIFPALGHPEEARCPECLAIAQAQGRPIEPDPH